MTIMLWFFGAAAVLELLLVYLPFLWRARFVLAITLVAAGAFAAGGLLAWEPNVFTALLLLFQLYRVFNMTRITEDRMHDAYLRHATRRTSSDIIVGQVLLLLAWAGWEVVQPHGAILWTVLASVQLFVALVFLASTFRRMKHTDWPRTSAHIADIDLPTLTVAIPARNETEDLQLCLQSLIASNYPKLEIIVLDDCSQTKRTSEIIRDFAHDGVRFVQGEQPSDTWLPKNQAYNRLVEEASGQYILFCGVDVRFQPDSLRSLALLMHSKKKEMASILPWRLDGSGDAFIQALRYWWELVPPRRLFRRPPVLSTCWIVSRKVLEESGGFRAVARSITPEAFFARKAAERDAYSFIRASKISGIGSVKSPLEQLQTAVRTRYPQLHRRPENVLVVSLAEFVFLVLPFAMVLGGLFIGVGWLAWALALVSSAALIATYEKMLLSTRTGKWPFGIVGALTSMVFDIGLQHYSMWLYEFSEVDWKGRNICIPAMHVIPHLPKI
jgi:chlorobactene glucosyltransferase